MSLIEKFEHWQFRIQQYLQHEHYALWEVIKFGDSYEAPKEDAATTSDGFAKKKGRTVTVTTEDVQKRMNDVKARTTLLLSLPDEHQLRFSKYKTTQELWAAILKTFGGNEATKKMKKNLLKQQYGNFKAEETETLEQTFNRLQVIVNQLESDLDTISLDDLYNHLKVYESEVQKKSESNSQNMAFITSAKHSSGNEEVNTASVSTISTNVSPASANIRATNISQDITCAYIASQSNGSQIKFEDINQIDEDDIEEMDIKWNMALLSMRADRFWKKTRKKISIQGTNVAGFDKSKVECFNCHKMGHFARSAELPEAKTEEEETITDKGLRPSPAIESTSDDVRNRNTSVTKTEASPSTISPKPFIKFVKATVRPTKNKIVKVETIKKPVVKYAEQYRKPSKKSTVKGNQRNSNNLKSQQLDENFVMKNRACFDCSHFDHLSYDCGLGVKRGRTCSTNTHKNNSPIHVVHKTHRPQMRPIRPNVKAAKPKRTSFYKPAHSYAQRPFQRESAGSSQNNIDDKGYWDSDCSRHMTGNISYLSDYEPFNRGYVSFGQGGCKITGKGTIKTGKLEFENVYFAKDFKYNLFSVLQICDNKNSMLFTDSECIVLGRDSKLIDDTNVLLRTPRQHNMYSIDLNNIVPHKDLTCLVAKDSSKESLAMLGLLSRMTPYELFNVRTPAIGFLKPFGCYVMILNTLDNLGKFEVKGDEGYFIGYSMSSKAFRVFNKRTKRVEENLHVDFLKNKAIEKGAGPNWYKGCSKTRGKERCIFLRYIALPNWVHDALLESSSSKPQDDCSTDVPESSGNSNPTATSINPPADQMETLTMETPIPTVSSPVPTACFTNSQEPSSDTRLISKRVANKVETPSLDNILTLTNRFEEILRVTTNSVDSDGEEADISNMETTITASLTPTLRIHKDHPKSQIIGHVDTPIQIRHKSKEVGEHSVSLEKSNKNVFETYKNVKQEIRDQLNAEAEAVQIILIGIDNDIYSTVDACLNACEMWKAIERLK
nr:ribonuclease H-like domain-containing protein [Tanacetum cinerariifolium]